ncbi:hypothetical protein A33Q_2541 [Indibacter alkaliphilus LW1]|uniref:Uncharacterized protein n=1 Tax=Indibacter alkaliphilus (strain CCUG 57479 / KCTC 22604 / LW1) TaxID=1189612 RepID=S2E1I7_INDAL|nr:hypothetical protein [Indibacter alkaliphilus]EOZ95948.1 hypothetical protein A33Q_2541 [Indibacter alkaliphilus LW1]
MSSITWYNGLIILGMLLSIPYLFMPSKEYRIQHIIVLIKLIVISATEVKLKHLGSLGINNSFIANIGYLSIGISLIFLYFYFLMGRNKYILFLWIIYLIFILLNSLFSQPIATSFQNYTWALSSIMIIGMSLYFFYSIFSKNLFEDKNLISIPSFWIVSFLMFFYACTFLYFLSFNFSYKVMDLQLFDQLRFLMKILGSSMYLVMGLAFYAPLIFKNSPTLKSK